MSKKLISNHNMIQLVEGDITIPIPQNYKDCIKLIQSDYYRLGGG